MIGKLRLHNGKITPTHHNRIKVWDIENVNKIEYNGINKLLNEPTGEYLLLDCMNDKQLFEWFRGELKKIEPTYVNMLDKKAKWRNEIPKLFSDADKEKYEVDKVRFERIKDKFNILDLSISDIKTLIEKSDSLLEVFNNAIEKHKEELKSYYETELKEYRKEFETQKEEFQNTLNSLQKKQIEKEKSLNTLLSEIKETSTKIEDLEQNKERILGDFSIIKDVLKTESRLSTNENSHDAYVMEECKKTENITPFSSVDEFISELKHQLYKQHLFPNFAKRLFNITSFYNAVFIKDIRLGVAFVNALHNTKYIIQQVEPDWLHFKDFWNNGLGAIWQSAHENPDVLHFLLLEDINLSSPECYARPLLDTLRGIRNLIPFGISRYPENLKIFATTASTSDPEIGLPLIDQTFEGWGAIGYVNDIYQESNNEYHPVVGFAEPEFFEANYPDELEIEEIKSSAKQEFTELFVVE